MSEFLDAESLEWQPLRPDVTHGVFGGTLLRNGTTIKLVRVLPNGGFTTHRDPYGHLFYFLAGSGVVRVEDRESAATPGVIVRIDAGEAHSYENTGTTDLMLVSVNLP